MGLGGVMLGGIFQALTSWLPSSLLPTIGGAQPKHGRDP